MMHDSFCRLANKSGALELNSCPECGGGEHDIFCPVNDSSVAVPYCSCARIEMIRQDERSRCQCDIIRNVRIEEWEKWSTRIFAFIDAIRADEQARLADLEEKK